MRNIRFVARGQGPVATLSSRFVWYDLGVALPDQPGAGSKRRADHSKRTVDQETIRSEPTGPPV